LTGLNRRMSKTAGLLLRQARQERGLTLEEVAQATRIRVHYIRALEAGEFATLPSKTQTRGFLRSYASFLELDPEALLASLEEGYVAPHPDGGPVTKQSSPSEEAGALPDTIRIVPAEPPPEKVEVAADVSPADTVRVSPPGLPPSEVRVAPAEPASSYPSKVGSDELDAGGPYFSEIGGVLRRQRELLGLTLEEIERHTHLRKHYLQALEAGDQAGLPSPVQGRGMLNNYAAFLGLDPEPLLLQFAAGLQAGLAARKAAEQSKKPSKAPRRPRAVTRFRYGDLLFIAAVSIFLVGFVIWGAMRIFAARDQGAAPAATAPSIADVLLASPTATASATLLPASALPPPTLTLGPPPTEANGGGGLPPQGQGNVQVYVSVQERAWMRVVVDGDVEFEGRVLQGGAYTFAGNSTVEVLTGNGAALQVVFNQQDQGILGDYGEVVDLIYTAQGVLEPTPTASPTVTDTSLAPVAPTESIPPTQGPPELP
jgi:cytoskeleton protein RodZ